MFNLHKVDETTIFNRTVSKTSLKQNVFMVRAYFKKPWNLNVTKTLIKVRAVHTMLMDLDAAAGQRKWHIHWKQNKLSKPLFYLCTIKKHSGASQYTLNLWSVGKNTVNFIRYTAIHQSILLNEFISGSKKTIA